MRSALHLYTGDATNGGETIGKPHNLQRNLHSVRDTVTSAVRCIVVRWDQRLAVLQEVEGLLQLVREKALQELVGGLHRCKQQLTDTYKQA